MAAKKKSSLSDQQIRPKARELNTQDPIQRMPMVVSIEKIQTYDKNPRKHENESFNEIKESIRLKGLEQPFTITRRSGEQDYIIKAGGNTRLRALKELYEETGDKKFRDIHVIFEPFVSEADTLISHLTENDLRGNLMLIDRAQGIRDTKLSIETEKGLELSARELSAVLKEQGYSIDYTLIGILDYALERLYPHLTKSLDSGMGKPQVLKIRKFEKQAKQAWEDQQISLDKFENTFNQALLESDQERFDFNQLVDAFETATADAHQVSINTVRFFLERAMTVNRKPTPEELAAYKAELNESDSTNKSEEDIYSGKNQESNEKTPVVNEEDDDDDDDLNHQVPFAHDLEEDEPYDDSAASTESASDLSGSENDTSSSEADSNKELTLKDLRAISLDLAIQIASEANIEDLVIKLNDGYGWMLANSPQPIHFQNGFDESNPEFKSIWRVWSTLFSVSGATTQTNQEIIATHIREQNNDLRHALKGDFDSIETPSGLYISNISLINDFWLESTDDQMKSMMRLIDTQRQIQRLAKAISATLWKGFDKGEA